MEEEYICKIILELQPRSRRGYRRLFGIRENPFFNIDEFNWKDLEKKFLQEYNHQVLQRGQHIKCQQLIVAVKQIQSSSKISGENTQVEFRLKGIPLRTMNNQGIVVNQSMDVDMNNKNHSGIQIEEDEVYSCYCCECQRCLSDGDYYLKSRNSLRPIVCLSCYQQLFTDQCIRCSKSITFDQTNLRSDGLTSIHFVEHQGFYWHCDCCVCVTCLQSLIGKTFYQDPFFHQLFCLEHIPESFE